MQYLDFRKYKLLYATWTLLIGAFVFSIFEREWYTTFMAVITFVLTVLPIIFQKRYQIYIPPLLLSLIAVFAYSTVFLGEVGGYYEKFWWWDTVLHLGSAIAFGLLGFVILFIFFKEKAKESPYMIGIFTFCFAVAIGVLWEIFEFFMDQTFGWNMQKSGLMDTMSDLIINCIGASVSSIVAILYLQGKDFETLHTVIDEWSKDQKSY